MIVVVVMIVVMIMVVMVVVVRMVVIMVVIVVMIMAVLMRVVVLAVLVVADLLATLLRLALRLRGGILLGLAHVSFTISLGFGRKRARGSVETRLPAARPGVLCPAGFSSSRGTEGRRQQGYGIGCRASCHVTRKSRPRRLRKQGTLPYYGPAAQESNGHSGAGARAG